MRHLNSQNLEAPSSQTGLPRQNPEGNPDRNQSRLGWPSQESWTITAQSPLPCCALDTASGLSVWQVEEGIIFHLF